MSRRRSDRTVVALLAGVVLLAPLGWLWARSLVPDTYSVMGMGHADHGGGPAASHQAHAFGWDGPPPQPGDVPVSDLTGPRDGRPDVEVTLVARQETVTLPTGEVVGGYTLDHASPGPLIRARQGDLVQVTLVNESVRDGTTLHWHGVDVPNAEDGVAGITQDAVAPGEEHVYRFVVEDPGTYWYHAHQVSHEQVRQGLFGVLVVEPPPAEDEDVLEDVLEVVAPIHTYGGLLTVDGATGERRVDADAGTSVRVRVVNTDDGPLAAQVVGADYRVLAVDGRDVVGPTPLSGTSLQVPAGGRADLAFDVPVDGSAARVQLGAGGTAVVVGPAGAPAPPEVAPGAELDLLSYGSPAPLGFDPAAADRRFEYSIGRRPGFVDGRPGLHWSINGHLFPDVPMYVVEEGDLVRMTVENHSGQLHPMHLHGHHAVVLSRDGVPASGSPWWVDSLDVASGDSYEIAFVADNPGIWADHCHKLAHAAEGLVAHLAYEGISTPFRIGGSAGNEPE
ncbi:MAG TPA: multicopper oxidase family protein [Jiangellales bacterium]|nr:multicopper oxidase family protein [Jiangellales bacterium]